MRIVLEYSILGTKKLGSDRIFVLTKMAHTNLDSNYDEYIQTFGKEPTAKQFAATYKIKYGEARDYLEGRSGMTKVSSSKPTTKPLSQLKLSSKKIWVPTGNFSTISSAALP